MSPIEKLSEQHALEDATAKGPSLPHVISFKHPVVLFPSIVFCLTLIDLFGWTFHIAILTSGLPHFSTMKPNTALALGLLAVCCRARVRRGGDGKGRLSGIPRCALGIAMVLSCGTLFEYLSARSLGLDGLILGVPLDRFGDPPGRMALGTALCLTLTGLAIGFLDNAPKFSLWMLLTASMITCSALLGFVINRGPLFNVVWLRSLAMPTTVCLIMLAATILVSRPERRPVSLLFTSEESSRRRYWPLLKGVVLALLGAVPSVVAMRTGIPEGVGTFLLLAVSLYSVHAWLQIMDSVRAE